MLGCEYLLRELVDDRAELGHAPHRRGMIDPAHQPQAGLRQAMEVAAFVRAERDVVFAVDDEHRFAVGRDRVA